MFEPRVTVIIPAYNREGVIGRAIRSVLAQSLQALEVVVVDDASSDGTADVVERIGDRRLRVVRCCVNRGGSVARNVGIDEARGDYVAFLDSDDVWCCEKLRRQVELIAGLKNREEAICYTNVMLVAGSLRRPHNRILFQNGSNMSDYLFVESQMVQTSTLLLSTALAKRLRFDERLRRHQDWDFVIRAASMGVTFVGTSEPLVEYHEDWTRSRISHSRSEEPSIYWQELVAAYMSRRAAASFFVSNTFPLLVRRRPVVALKKLRAVCASGSISYGKVLRMLAKQLLPNWIVRQIRYRRPGLGVPTIDARAQ